LCKPSSNFGGCTIVLTKFLGKRHHKTSSHHNW